MSQSGCRLLPHGASRPQMIEPGVLGLGLFQEREVGVGVFRRSRNASYIYDLDCVGEKRGS